MLTSRLYNQQGSVMAHKYSSYGKRVGGFLIDLLYVWVPPFIIGSVGFALLFSDMARPVGIVLIVIALFWWPVTTIWNYIIRQGKSGQTFGKARVGIKLISEETGQPIGAGYAFLRWFLAALLGAITGSIFTIVDLIFPAFDEKKQRVLDKMLKTVVVDNNGGSTNSRPTVSATTTDGPARNLYS
jgi:uncharacterized RDD family membrane protein YckC